MVLYSTTKLVIGQPPLLVISSHLTSIEVEDVASTDTVVGAEGAKVCVIAERDESKHA